MAQSRDRPGLLPSGDPFRPGSQRRSTRGRPTSGSTQNRTHPWGEPWTPAATPPRWERLFKGGSPQAGPEPRLGRPTLRGGEGAARTGIFRSQRGAAGNTSPTAVDAGGRKVASVRRSGGPRGEVSVRGGAERRSFAAGPGQAAGAPPSGPRVLGELVWGRGAWTRSSTGLRVRGPWSPCSAPPEQAGVSTNGPTPLTRPNGWVLGPQPHPP